MSGYAGYPGYPGYTDRPGYPAYPAAPGGFCPPQAPQTPVNPLPRANPDWSLAQTVYPRKHLQRAKGGASNLKRQLATQWPDAIEALWDLMATQVMRRAHEFHQVFGASAVLAELGQTDEVIKIIGASSGTTASTARHALMRFSLAGKTEVDSGHDINIDFMTCVNVNGGTYYHRFNLFLQAKCMKPSKMGKPEEDHQYHEPPGLWNVNWSYVSKEERKQAERHGGPARDQAALLALYADASAEYYRDDCQKQQRGKGNGDGSSTDPFQHFCAAFLVYSPLGTYIVPTQLLALFTQHYRIDPRPGVAHDRKLSEYFRGACGNLLCKHIIRHALFPEKLKDLLTSATIEVQPSKHYLEQWTENAVGHAPQLRPVSLYASHAFDTARFPSPPPALPSAAQPSRSGLSDFRDSAPFNPEWPRHHQQPRHPPYSVYAPGTAYPEQKYPSQGGGPHYGGAY